MSKHLFIYYIHTYKHTWYGRKENNSEYNKKNKQYLILYSEFYFPSSLGGPWYVKILLPSPLFPFGRV